MRKNFGEIFGYMEVDPISGEYFIRIPEVFANELAWYEETEINFTLDGNDLILTEKKDDWETISHLYQKRLRIS